MVFQDSTLNQLKAQVTNHRQMFGLPIGDVEADVNEARAWTLEQVKTGTLTMVEWAMTRGEVPPEEVARRSEICSKCKFNQPLPCRIC